MGRSDEPTAIYTQAQNGGGERSGGMISRQAIAMRIAARFPEEFWSEIWLITVYLYNRIPCKTTGWKSPLEMHNIWLRNHGGDTSLLNDLPTLVHLSVYSCRGYIFNEAWLKDTNRSARKNWPRADIGYLCGYKENESTRCFWIPNPTDRKRVGYVVVKTRDVQVDETVFYNPDPPTLQRPTQPAPQSDRIVEIEDNDTDSDTGSIVSVTFTVYFQTKDDPDDSEEEVDPFAEDPLADRPG